MTATYTNCANIIIDSTLLNVTNQTVTLEVTKNCAATPVVTKDVSAAATEITLVPADFNEEDIISDGIYYFKLTIVDNGGDTTVESLCKFLNCSTTCDLLDVYNGTTKDCDRAMAYFALLASQDCTNCSCSDLCLLYSIATNDPCEDVEPCGCS